MSEHDFLDKVSSTYKTSTSMQDLFSRKQTFIRMLEYLKPEMHVLELGCSDGWFTSQLANYVDKVTSIEGSKNFYNNVSEMNLENVDLKYSLFEDFYTDQRFDFIANTYVMEHVLDPVNVMLKTLRFLKPGGISFIAVPNATALSRQIGKEMGYYSSLYDLTENDLCYGHRRVYDLKGLEEDVKKSGYKVIDKGGISLKILADFQLDELYSSGFLTEKHSDAFISIANKYPELSGQIFIVGEKL